MAHSIRSRLHSRVARIVEGLQRDLGGHLFAGDLQLIGAACDVVARETVRIADIAVTDRATDGLAVAAAGQPPDPFTVPIDGLPTEQHDRRIACEPGEHLANATRALLRDRAAASEIDLAAQLHGPPEPRFDRRVIRPDVAAPRPVTL